MAFEQRDMSGALFENDKEGNPARPDLNGSGMVFGKLIRIAAWAKTSANGKDYLSISFQEHDNGFGGDGDGAKKYLKPQPAGEPKPGLDDDKQTDFKADIPF